MSQVQSQVQSPQAPRGPSRLAQAISRPGRAWYVARALLKGHFYKRWYALRGIRFRAGRNLRVHGSLSVRGPGEVIFGDDVTVNGHATPWTYSREARIVIGSNVIMGSARFGCVREITVGDDCLLAAVQFTDTDWHSARADRRTDAAPVRVAPVRIERNVWLGENAAILAGTTIGENSVVGFGAICMRAYPPNVTILGNPAKVVGPIPPMPDAAPAAAAPSADAAVLPSAASTPTVSASE